MERYQRLVVSFFDGVQSHASVEAEEEGFCLLSTPYHSSCEAITWMTDDTRSRLPPCSPATTRALSLPSPTGWSQPPVSSHFLFFFPFQLGAGRPPFHLSAPPPLGDKTSRALALPPRTPQTLGALPPHRLALTHGMRAAILAARVANRLLGSSLLRAAPNSARPSPLATGPLHVREEGREGEGEGEGRKGEKEEDPPPLPCFASSPPSRPVFPAPASLFLSGSTAPPWCSATASRTWSRARALYVNPVFMPLLRPSPQSRYRVALRLAAAASGTPERFDAASQAPRRGRRSGHRSGRSAPRPLLAAVVAAMLRGTSAYLGREMKGGYHRLPRRRPTSTARRDELMSRRRASASPGSKTLV
nr:unnamed protein product [Digitaria exilis]